MYKIFLKCFSASFLKQVPFPGSFFTSYYVLEIFHSFFDFFWNDTGCLKGPLIKQWSPEVFLLSASHAHFKASGSKIELGIETDRELLLPVGLGVQCHYQKKSSSRDDVRCPFRAHETFQRRDAVLGKVWPFVIYIVRSSKRGWVETPGMIRHSLWQERELRVGGRHSSNRAPE